MKCVNPVETKNPGLRRGFRFNQNIKIYLMNRVKCVLLNLAVFIGFCEK